MVSSLLLVAAIAVLDGQTVGVTVGKARFTPVSERMIRCEWSEDGVFEDRPSLTFVNRDVVTADVQWERKVDGLVLRTGCTTLEWTGGPFDENNLVVNGVRVLAEDKGNLLGTTRTLDGATGLSNVVTRMEKGLFSRRGVTVVDDTATPLLAKTTDHWGQWAAERRKVAKGAYRDLTVCAFGRDFRGGLKEYTDVAGRIPLPPRWAFGYWWSRYWLYTDKEIRELVGQMKSVGVPLDVFVIDMEWHETWDIGARSDLCDEVGELWGWTGYTWNRRLFPDPKQTLDYLHANGCKVALNLHPASGIQPCESCYADFCRDYGWTGTNAVPYRGSEAKWADCYFKDALGPLERDGVDFWWLDWQQWKMSKYMPSLSNTFWLNHLFNAHMAQRDGGAKRPLIYHRWGGLGSHRYQVGFSGDSKVAWSMLEAIPWFTATSANVCYGYWGHDIGGHHNPDGNDGLDGELYTRWLQSGVFTPIFKTHSTKDANIERRIWRYPDYFFALRDALRLRYRLAPYVYTAARQAYDTGVSMCRPMYYDSPDDEAAYCVTNAYMFGDHILAATISKPMDKVSRRSTLDVWFPKGKWYDMSTGEMIEGGSTRTLQYSISEHPWFAKAGAVIPMYPESIDNLANVRTEDLEFVFVPGADRGFCTVYEDDGETADYAGRGRWTEVSREGSRIVIGNRPGAYTLRFPCLAAPRRVTVNGSPSAWEYDVREFAVVVKTPRQDGTHPTVVELTLPENAEAVARQLFGLKGRSARIDEISAEFKTLLRPIHWAMNLPESWQTFWQTPAAIAADPANLADHLSVRKSALRQFVVDFAPLKAKLPQDFVVRMTDLVKGP